MALGQVALIGDTGSKGSNLGTAPWLPITVKGNHLQRTLKITSTARETQASGQVFASHFVLYKPASPKHHP